jgi:hypothetical protein
MFSVAVREVPFSVAVMTDVASAVTAPAVTLKAADPAPPATETVAGAVIGPVAAI